ncbi:MAG: T9SS type A sorting domain-containing protein [Chitinophagaceae bacterium]|nr:T9SS type A sorting domain-containing protein [Chitinophagaceae bacterium]
MKKTSYKLCLAFGAAMLCANLTNALPKKLKVLFIGNSYTAFNTLPLLTRDVAFSVGDTLITDWTAPGGYTLEQHASDIATLGKISVGDWNYVVLQEQSQRPAFTDADVMRDVYPYAKKLDSIIHDKNNCGRSVFFQTWGYKNGDGSNCLSFPPICTYEGMDSMLALRYKTMATANEALLSPVGQVFKELRKAHPGIELYSPDLSHPSEAGSYAAAVTFYTILFGKDPTLITFSYSIPPTDAINIRLIVKAFVYDHLVKFGFGTFDPDAMYTYSSAGGNTINFSSASSVFVDNYSWDFGDGGTSNLPNPSHTYAVAGTYTVRLIGDNCIINDTATQSVNVGPSSINESTLLSSISLFPNPANNVLNIESTSNISKLSFQITNLLCISILENTTISNNAIDISNIATGIYLLRITDKETGAVATMKFVKE